MVVATHAANRNIAYALFTGATNDIYKTTTGGTSWTQVTSPTFSIAQTYFSLCIGVHPTDPNIVVGGSYGWGYSTNGGTSWIAGGGLEVDFHSIHFHPSNPNMAYIGYDQGFGSVNFANNVLTWVWNGTGWVQESQAEQIELGKTTGFNTAQIYYGDYFPQAYGDDYVYGQQDGGCFGKVSGNERRILVGDGCSVFINKQNPLKVFASTQDGALKASSNAIPINTSTYSSVGSFIGNHPNWITNFAGNNADGSQLYMANNTTIQRTLDGGISFASIASHTLGGVKVAVQSTTNPIVYAIGYKTGTYNSDLKGISSAATTPVVTTATDLLTYSTDGVPDQITVDPNIATTIYITGTRGTAYQVSNANTALPTKTSIKGNIPTVIFNIVIGVKNKPNVLLAGTNVGLFSSEDGGITWILNTEIPYTQITDLKLRESDNRLFVFTHGRGAWAVTLNFTITDVAANTSGLVKIFPNPSHDVININTMLHNTSVIIFDIDGKKVYEGNDISMVDVKSLSPGVYILHLLQEGKLLATEKIVVQ